MKTIGLLILVTISTATFCFSQKPKPPKPDTGSGSSMEIVVEKDGQKTEIKSSRFSSADGYALNQPNGKTMLFFGASSDGAQADSFTFSGSVASTDPGVYPMGGTDSKAQWTLQASPIKGATTLMPKAGGSVEITTAATITGFVTGKFQAVCQTVTDAGTVEEYTVSGTFKLVKR